MLSLKDYGIALAKGLLPLVVAIALVNLINASNWQYLLNYYVICNYLTFYPYNLNQAKPLENEQPAEQPLRRSKSKPAPEGLRRSHDDRTAGDKASEILSSWVLAFGKHLLLLLVAPGLFISGLLFSNEVGEF